MRSISVKYFIRNKTGDIFYFASSFFRNWRTSSVMCATKLKHFCVLLSYTDSFPFAGIPRCQHFVEHLRVIFISCIWKKHWTYCRCCQEGPFQRWQKHQKTGSRAVLSHCAGSIILIFSIPETHKISLCAVVFKEEARNSAFAVMWQMWSATCQNAHSASHHSCKWKRLELPHPYRNSCSFYTSHSSPVANAD